MNQREVTSRAMDPAPRAPSIDTVAGLLADAARRGPARPAIEHGAVRWTYADLAARAAELAQDLSALGVRPGDVVAFIGENGPECACAYFGAAWAGAILAPLHLRLLDADLVRVLAHADAKVVLADPASLERARRLGRPCVSLDATASGNSLMMRRS